MTLRDALVLGGVVAGIGGLIAADHGIQHTVQKNTSATGRDVADVFNGIGSPAAILGLNVGLIAIGVTQWSYTGDSRLKNAALVSLESEIFTLASVFIIQEAAGRARPDQGKGATHFRPFSGGDSFPSGHAAVSFSTAAVFADRYEQPVGGIAYGLASVVALARVYSDKHFASDVVAGGLLGWVIGKALSARHSYLDSDIEIRPLILDRGQAIGAVVVKPF
jgi:membrane-associated phospholipid phosphatase